MEARIVMIRAGGGGLKGNESKRKRKSHECDNEKETDQNTYQSLYYSKNWKRELNIV